ncbi:MAG: aminodeoxychorismate synthase component I [Sulfuriferula sp.]|nr:aminodeoxychorismate synthase component I [Sulfuriferula sp.]
MPSLRLSSPPDLLALHAQFPAQYPVLLETAVGAGWDILMAYPAATHLFDANHAADFLPQLAQQWADSATVKNAEMAHLPFRGGWFVYLGYELLHEIEPVVTPRVAQSGFPTAALLRIPAAIMVDKTHQQTWVFAESAATIAAINADISSLSPMRYKPAQVQAMHEETDADFLAGVAKIQDYIAAGDVFQVNLSRRWRGQVDNTAADIYQSLRQQNPAPFAGSACLGNAQYILSSSPERLVQVQDGRAITRPIAGTHPRHSDAQQDAQIKADLLAHPKERAEHVMLVDLERNDLGRVCVPGSVTVDELMAVATYQHVHHIESTVSGQLRPDITPVALIKALFPGGTITGCPKIRTMQIIRELEQTPRDAYTGSMGYINLDGDLDLNILIRTLMLSAQTLTFSAGAGIVKDSNPERELHETRAKAKGLLRAVGVGA